MLVPCMLKFGLESADGGNQQQLAVSLVDDKGHVLHTLDEVPLSPGQDFSFGPVYVSATIDSALDTEHATPPTEPTTPQSAAAPMQGAKRGNAPGRPNQPTSRQLT